MSAGVLLVTADPGLTSTVPRLCALAGTTCDVQRDSDATRTAWREPATVLVGFDVAPALAMAALPRRDGVLVLTSGPADTACWEAALALGARAVLQVPAQDAALVDALRAGPSARLNAARVVAVVGGCGGAGASTLSAALALTASRSGTSLLLDGDPLGGGLDVLVGAESVPGVRWNELGATRGRLDPSAFAAAICDVHGIGLLSWGRPAPAGPLAPEAVDAVLAAASHAFDTVVIDLARLPSRTGLRMLEASDCAVVVVPAEVRPVAAAAALIAALGRRLAAAQLVVRDPGGHGLAAKDVAASLGLPLAATLRSEPSVQLAAQRGEPPTRRGRSALGQACEELWSALAAAHS